MFLTDIRDFDHRPYIVDGEIVRDRVVLEGNIVWLDVKNDKEYTVPKGFVFDLASLPWWTGWALTKLGKHQRAAALHDWFYVNRINTKAWSDAQFRLAMADDGVAGWRKYMAWSGVALCGWPAWWSKDEIIIVEEDT
ncbi:MAG TPA: hypothetical protein DCZ13_07565 [Porticoccaceae bacterium]|nr:hypothetical protein [Porticoccaceae bacterium]